ncbi:proline reductase cluster protein PrdD [Xylocopilactobacillus apicola]|uniref:Proline reductase cluster protein PrdD n=1 Tax=Xylocopilactobacillus apicola TaxID=2932184 RepID=A0AAU9DL65_9LACO|nr:proline reductase cluster protein PrdD [Xylocopilactobacillus apicola]BDR57612.1 proline reductase cluster protein PrdD [Xylocopilactobacillus apicola]
MPNETLKIKEFIIDHVQIGDSYQLKDHQLVIPKKPQEVLPADFQSVEIKVLPPNQLDVPTNAIMDVIPISTKVLGNIGEGITHTLTGTCVLLTGADQQGRQIHDFGSSDGILKDQIMLDRDGTPGTNDYIIMFNVIVKSTSKMDRKSMTEIFAFADAYIQPIRKILKVTNGLEADYTHEYVNEVHPGKPKVAIVKQVSGQGAMYDNLLFAKEPSGMEDGISIIDLNNFPVLLTPNEYRDGAIRAMV